MAVAMAVLSMLFSTGCGSKTESDETTIRAGINAKNWPRCSEMSEKTIYDAYFESDEFAERLLLAGRVSTVIGELEESRKKFIDEGSLEEIFPLLFYYQMKESLEFSMKPRLVHKTEFLQILLNTYDAYKTNRNAFDSGEPDSVDKQWRAYFKAAEKAAGNGDWTADDGVDVLLDGVNANVLYDLPRAVREVVKKSDVDKSELTDDFIAADSIYQVAEESAKRDILKHFGTSAEAEEAQKLFGNGAEYVRFSRGKAWEMGIGNGPLGMIEEQPHLPHDAESRKYFPKELMKRGICR